MREYSTYQILLATIVLAAATIDLRSRRIPNWITLPGTLTGLLLNGVTSGLDGLEHSVEGMLLGFGVYFLLYLLRAMGAGDVKLMAAVGAIVGPEHWVPVFIASSLAGGVLALVLMVYKGRGRETLRNSVMIAQELGCLRAPFKRNPKLDFRDLQALKAPHGLAIAAGTMTCLLLAVI